MLSKFSDNESDFFATMHRSQLYSYKFVQYLSMLL